ncbi:Protein ral2 [Choanephora cucurbitarum]|uniref:Protein ral2 n=1 Tax=Choanephora cucurbitarum TaxID=101091 RepID=A0A1C7N0H9_9FUNG|nr:Protein ral2 [Choanephora cucurbitarum]
MAMSSSMQMQSISGIITQIHVTTGEVPPALVGASVNVIGDKVYVFAGRLATSRTMTNYLYILDLTTLSWTQHIPPPDSDRPPKARYFHSASVHNDQLIIFGGMGHSSRMSSDSNGLLVLDDIAIFDIQTMCWTQPTIPPSLYSPQARYAHLSAITEDRLVVMGGQDLENNYLDQINVLNLQTMEWEQATLFEKHVGAYRSIAVTAPTSARFPIQQEEAATPAAEELSESPFDQQAMSVQSSTEDGNPIYLYTNYNFSDVKRELQLIYTSSATKSPQAIIEEHSNLMNGSVMPPGLRFPTGYTLGNHLILAGTYLSPQTQSYTIWSLDLTKLTWSRIETGSVFSSGSWNRGVLHEASNRLLVFGNSNRNLLDDYNHRQVNFEHLAMVDLEAFGVYTLPKPTCSSLAQEMGLRLLNEPAVSDFYIITQDNISIPVNSAVLGQRWPYFARLMKENVVQQTKRFKESILDEKIVEEEEEEEDTKKEPTTEQEAAATKQEEAATEQEVATEEEATEQEPTKEGAAEQEPTKEEATEQEPTKEEVIKPIEEVTEESIEEEEQFSMIKSHYMSFPYPHTVVIALLQFIYTDNLLTAQQYQPQILSQLLLLADMYDIPRLSQLATHALHQMLNMSTAPLIFETAALSHQTSLQIRALKMMIAAKKMIQQQQQQQQQSRSRTVSTPTTMNSLEQTPVSPTASLSSSSYHLDKENTPITASPTLQSFRSRRPSASQNRVHGPSTYSLLPQPQPQPYRTSTLTNLSSPLTSPTAATSYSLPNNSPSAKLHSQSEVTFSQRQRRSSSPPKPNTESKSTPKETKKKKKAFLEAFGKLSSSISK